MNHKISCSIETSRKGKRAIKYLVVSLFFSICLAGANVWGQACGACDNIADTRYVDGSVDPSGSVQLCSEVCLEVPYKFCYELCLPTYLSHGMPWWCGTEGSPPFQYVLEGILDAPLGGKVIIAVGNYSESMVVSHQVELQSSRGTVVIGVEASPLLRCGTSASSIDADGDGLEDSCEQFLAEKYAPIIYHSNDESNYPTNVDWFLSLTSLWFYADDCEPDKKTLWVRTPSQHELLGRTTNAGCDYHDTIYSDGTRSEDKERTFYLEDVPEQYRIGSLDTRQWATYYHAYRNEDGGVTIQYWRFYAYNDAANNHGGDWEGIHVVLDSTLNLVKVGFLGHTTIDYSGQSNLQMEGNHPRIFSEGGGHASHPSGVSVFAYSCDNPEFLIINPDDTCTFTRQETWTGGQVQWCTYPDNALCTGLTSQAGDLVNLGSKLSPLNEQVFIQYSGIWGSPGLLYEYSGYWGPAFNETAMGRLEETGGSFINDYSSAWCAGMDEKHNDRECMPCGRSN